MTRDSAVAHTVCSTHIFQTPFCLHSRQCVPHQWWAVNASPPLQRSRSFTLKLSSSLPSRPMLTSVEMDPWEVSDKERASSVEIPRVRHDEWAVTDSDRSERSASGPHHRSLHGWQSGREHAVPVVFLVSQSRRVRSHRRVWTPSNSADWQIQRALQ